jgi:acetyl esterase/lipase
MFKVQVSFTNLRSGDITDFYFIFEIRNIWLGGHSAGAHLAASMIHPAVHEHFSIKGFILISGIFDLSPLLETTINIPLKLNK